MMQTVSVAVCFLVYVEDCLVLKLRRRRILFFRELSIYFSPSFSEFLLCI